MAHHFHHYTHLSSTNAEAGRLVKEGLVKKNGFVISDYQTDGKGRSGNTWDSEAGKNLLMSWITFPAFLSASHQFQLSKAVSLALIDLLKNYKLDAEIKWPNDIICKGRKIAGILIENSIRGTQLQHSIVGIGMNVNQKHLPGYDYQADSLANLLGTELDLNSLYLDTADHLERRYQQISEDESAPDAMYLQYLYRFRTEAKFRLKEKEISGSIQGVNELGELLVETQGNIHSYGFHEIRMIY
jgi:BirA family biotin operon repressor/biotin-[acetyl-CoA-carboxylase] ligase